MVEITAHRITDIVIKTEKPVDLRSHLYVLTNIYLTDDDGNTLTVSAFSINTAPKITQTIEE